MAKSSIYEKIEKKGEQEAAEIYRLGQEKAKQLEADILTEAQNEIEKILEKARITCNTLNKTKITQYEQNMKQAVLHKKKELIDKVFLLSLERLKALNDQELTKLVAQLLDSEQIQGKETVKVSQSDFPRYLKLFSSGKQENGNYVLDRLPLKNRTVLYLSKDFSEIDGGFILVGENFDIDLSFKTILENLKEKTEIALAELLFENEG